MITKVKQNFTALIFNALDSDVFSKICKPRKFFIAHTFWLFASIKGRIGHFFARKERRGECHKMTPDMMSSIQSDLDQGKSVYSTSLNHNRGG